MIATNSVLWMVAVVLSGCVLGGCSRSGSSEYPTPQSSTAVLNEDELQVRYLQALVTREPRHWRAQVRLASFHTSAGRHNEAFRALHAAWQIAPENVGLNAVLAEAAAEVDYLDWAIHGWREVIRLNPQDVGARVRLSQLYRRLDWIVDADAVLSQALRIAPDSLPVLRERASLDAAAGFRSQVKQWASLLVRHHPKAPYGYSLLADIHASAGEWRQAVAQGSAALERDPKSVPLLTRQAQYHLLRTDAPDPSAALMLLQTARIVAPEDPGVRYWTGMAFRRLGRAEEARVEFEWVYGRDPEFEAVGFQLAELYRAAGRHGEAGTLLSAAAGLDTQRRALREASARYRQRPLSAQAHFDLGRARLADRQYGAAVVEFMAARLLDPSLPGTREGLNEALSSQKRELDLIAPLGRK